MTVAILAAGYQSRYDKNEPKLFRIIDNKPVYEWIIKEFEKKDVNFYVFININYSNEWKEKFYSLPFEIKEIVSGDGTAPSIKRALTHIDDDVIIFHWCDAFIKTYVSIPKDIRKLYVPVKKVKKPYCEVPFGRDKKIYSVSFLQSVDEGYQDLSHFIGKKEFFEEVCKICEEKGFLNFINAIPLYDNHEVIEYPEDIEYVYFNGNEIIRV